MSRQPSPGPAIPGQQASYYRDAHGLPIEKGHLKIVYRAGEQAEQSQRGAPPSGTVATSSSSSGRTKSRAYQSGIAAGAEDVKYAAKYRDLKAKVKDIESDNDRLVFKVLQAKRNIQRAKLERAILYERLGALPASPPPGNAPLPPQHVAQQAPPGAHVPRHADAPAYRESGRRQRTSGSSVPHHHHSQHHQQPIQPAPPPHVSPPEHHMQAHHPHHPPHDMAHPGQLPITHAQQVCTIQTAEGPLVVVAGPDGRPVTTADGLVIPAQDIHAPPPPSAPSHRKRGGRVSKEVRELREKEAREMREREEMERKREQAIREGASGQAPGGPPPPEPTRSSSSSRSHSAHMQGVSPQLAPQVPGASQVAPASSREQRERQRDWEVEREVRDRERAQRREAREDSSVHGGHHHHHHHHHGHRYQERIGGSPPPPGGGSGPSPIRTSPPPPLHRSHSHSSHYSGHSHGHVHSHSHSHSPHSPGGGPYPHTRIHGHQRVGPGSYVMRDRERADAAAAAAVEQANAATPTAPAPVPVNEEANASAPAAASSSRVPTPPYMQRPARGEAYNNNHASPPATGEDVAPPISGAKTDVRPAVEDGATARSSSTTPS